MALTDLPSYVAKTDSAGMFRVTNIKDDTYRIMAIDDARGNYLFVPSETKVGFIDSLIQTISFPTTVYDTIHPDTTVVEGRRTKKGMEFKVVSKDTIVRRDFTMFGPTNLFIPMFDEEKTQLYLVDEARKERERLDFTFSIPADNQLNVRLLGVHLLDKINRMLVYRGTFCREGYDSVVDKGLFGVQDRFARGRGQLFADGFAW